MYFFFFSVVTIVIAQRLLELRLARKNAAYIRSQGGREAGITHYKYLVALHTLFFLSLIVEVLLAGRPLDSWWWMPFSLFILAQFGRYWCIRSLGHYWNTRIFISPKQPLITHGPYRYLRHPNYLIVGIELFTLPFTFSAYTTAAIFTLLNMWLLLSFRIPIEEKSLEANLDENLEEDSL